MTTKKKTRGLGVTITPKRWAKMTRPQRRVALAKDVLQLISRRHVRASTGNYIRARNLDCSTEDDAREVLRRIDNCEVCAKGGLLFAHVIGVNGVTMGDIGAWETWGEGVRVETRSDTCATGLKDSFEKEVLDRIEAAFEGHFISGDERQTPHWVDKYPTASRRLAAIMRRFRNFSWPMTHARGPSPEDAIKAAMAEVNREALRGT